MSEKKSGWFGRKLIGDEGESQLGELGEHDPRFDENAIDRLTADKPTDTPDNAAQGNSETPPPSPAKPQQ